MAKVCGNVLQAGSGHAELLCQVIRWTYNYLGIALQAELEINTAI